MPYTFDAHNDTLMRLVKDFDSFSGSDSGHVDLPRLQAGEVAAQVFAVFTESHFRPGQSLQRALRMISTFWRMVEQHEQHMGVVQTADDLVDLRSQGRLAALLSLEGAEPLGVDIENLDIMFRLGVRAITLTWNHRNALADGVEEEGRAGGLSSFGWQVVEAMAEKGMVVDVSHLAVPGFWDVLKSNAAVIASHSNAQSLHFHRRNLSDEQLKALSTRGGVVGVNFCPAFIAAKSSERITRNDLVDHIEYLLNTMGSEAVGLGSDFDGISHGPEGLEDASTFPTVAEELRRRGIASSVIDKVMGENFFRLFSETLAKR